MTPQLESSLRKRFPDVTFFFNHGGKQAHKEGKKGTMTAVVNGLIKLGKFKIHVKGQLASLNFYIGTRENNFISVYAPLEGETSRLLAYFKNLFQTKIIDSEKSNIISGLCLSSSKLNLFNCIQYDFL